MKLSLNFSFGLLVAMLTLVGCGAATQPPLPPLSIATATQIVAEATSIVAVSPLPSFTHTPPVVIPPTSTPTLESTPTNLPLLTTKDPSLDVVKTYLQSALGISFGKEQVDLFGREAVIYQEDINGDSSPDIVVDGQDYLVIMVWLGAHYSEPFYEPADIYGRCCPYSVTSLEDWTGDGVPEVVFDSTQIGGGSGFFIDYTTRSIYQCELDCKIIWTGHFSTYVEDYNCGGLERDTVDMNLVRTQQDSLVIRAVDQGFSVYRCSDIEDPLRPTTLYIDQSTLREYAWDGSEYVLSNESVVSLPQVIKSQANLTATNANGVTATIAWSPVFTASNQNDKCQLSVESRVVGAPFGCKNNFTTVDWKDITGDGLPEIVVIALSGQYTQDDDINVDAGCVNQRLLAYQWDGSHASEIAQVVGCVVRNDLFGVALQDYDHDGQPEILTSSKIYKWNGNKFTFWDDLPANP